MTINAGVGDLKFMDKMRCEQVLFVIFWHASCILVKHEKKRSPRRILKCSEN